MAEAETAETAYAGVRNTSRVAFVATKTAWSCRCFIQLVVTKGPYGAWRLLAGFSRHADKHLEQEERKLCWSLITSTTGRYLYHQDTLLVRYELWQQTKGKNKTHACRMRICAGESVERDCEKLYDSKPNQFARWLGARRPILTFIS